MPSWWEFIIIVLASWRIVTFIQREEGPFKIIFRIRSRLGIVHDDDHIPIGWPDNLIGDLFKCFWCLSFWISLILWIVWLMIPCPWSLVVFALSSGSILINEIITRLKDG
jgi:hypothetical protein